MMRRLRFVITDQSKRLVKPDIAILIHYSFLSLKSWFVDRLAVCEYMSPR